MPTEIGPQLLGRKPNPPDERDFTLAKLEEIATPPADFETKTIREAYDSTPYLSSWWGILVLWRWIKAYFQGPTPVPVPPSPDIHVAFGQWGTTIRLDQGDTGHCVGGAWCDWGNSTPVTDEYTNDDLHAVYYECKVIDGEPGAENGTYTRSGAKAMQKRGRLAAYAFGQSIEELDHWLDNHGSAVAGTNWYTAMFRPDANGYITIDGRVEGGHEWVILDRDPNARVYECMNDWGASWSKDGLFYVREEDMHRLLFEEDGDVCFALELPH